MGGFSKYFNEMVKGYTCCDLIHPWTPSCTRALGDFLKNYSFEGMKFFAPAIIISIIMKTKSNYTPAILKGIVDIFKCAFVGHVSFAIAMTWSCFFYKLFGRYYYYTFLFWPTFLGAQLAYLLPPHAVIGHAHPFACVVLEIIFKFSDYPLLKWLRNSLMTGTCMFMIFSAGILHFMKKHSTGVFWFLLPQRSPRNSETSCDHRGPCKDHIVQGLKQYAFYGIMLELLKNLFSRINLIKKNPLMLPIYLVKNPNLKFIKFLIVYVGLYRATTCLVNHYYKPARDYSSMIGGAAGGISYMFCPNYNLFTSCIVTFIQVYWIGLLKQKEAPKIITTINKLPLGILAYGLFIAISCQVLCFYPAVAPKFSYKTIKANSSGVVDGLRWHFSKVIFKPFLEFIR